MRISSPRNPPVLLHEDSQYAFKQISSIIKDEDYEDLGNHATEAMGDGPIQFGIGMFIRPFTSVPSYFCRSNIRF